MPKSGTYAPPAVPSVTGSDNGNVQSLWYQDNVNSSFGHTANYGYDAVNRLATASASTLANPPVPIWSQTYNYDRWGNMSCGPSSSGLCTQLAFNTSTNQITTIGSQTAKYDFAGNLTNDGSHTYQYDAEGHLVSVDSGATATETYGAMGWRVYMNGTSYLHDPSGRMIGGSFSGGGWNAFIWLGGRMLADYESDGAHMMHPNALDSNLEATDWTGSSGVQETLYYPFGSTWLSTPGSFVHPVFAGLPDADLFNPSEAVTQNRRYEYILGRWMTPDPTGGDIINPQSLNRYAYVLNNPTNLTDPLGLAPPRKQCHKPYWSARLCAGTGIDPRHWYWGSRGLPDLFELHLTRYEIVLLGPPDDTTVIEVPVPVTETVFMGGGMDPGSAITQQSQTPKWRLQTAVFLSTLGHNFINEFKDGGCVNEFFEGVNQADVLGPALNSPNFAETTIKATTGGMAFSYAAKKLLTVPMRSSIVRGTLELGETGAAAFGPAYADALEVWGLFGRELPAMAKGECQ